MPNFTDKIICPKCGKEFPIQVEINGMGNDVDAVVLPIEGPLDGRQMTFEEFAQDKLELLKLPSFYGGNPVTEMEQHRIDVIHDLLEEYQEKKRRGLLKK